MDLGRRKGPDPLGFPEPLEDPVVVCRSTVHLCGRTFPGATNGRDEGPVDERDGDVLVTFCNVFVG